MSAALIILQQLGGGRFIAMTGANSLVGGPTELQFHLPARFARNGINCVRVHLSADDTYLVSFYKVAKRGLQVKVVSTFEQVYCDQLRSLFTSETGLAVSL